MTMIKERGTYQTRYKDLATKEPEPKRQIGAYLTLDVADAVERFARSDCRSFSSSIAYLIKRGLESEGFIEEEKKAKR